MDEPSNAEKKEQGRRKPPPSLGRIAGEILAGTAMAAALALLSVCVVGYGTKFTFPGLGEGCMDGLLVLAVLGMMIIAALPVYMVGCVTGVYLVGRIGNQTGSFLATLGGGFLGLFVMALLVAYVAVADQYMVLGGIEKKVLWALAFLAAPIMATLCFNLTRRYKKVVSPRIALTCSV